MDRYFFHLDYGDDCHPDANGTDVSDLSRARELAVQFLGQMLRDEGGYFWNKPSMSVTVADHKGLTLWTLSTIGVTAPVIG